MSKAIVVTIQNSENLTTRQKVAVLQNEAKKMQAQAREEERAFAKSLQAAAKEEKK